MVAISDSRPEKDDVDNYLNQLKNRRGGASSVLSKKEANSLRKKQDNLINNYTYTNEDIQRSIQVTKTLKKKIGNIGAEKTRVNIAVQAARAALEEAKTQKVDLETKLFEADPSEENVIQREVEAAVDKIEALEKNLADKIDEQKKVLNAESLRDNQLKNNSKNKKWAEVNKKAIAANKAADIEAYKAEIALRKSGKKKKADPFARRKVKPRNLWNVGQDDGKDAKEDTGEKKNDNEDENVVKNEVDESGDTNQSSRDLRSSLKKKISETMNEVSIDEEAIPKLMASNNKKTVTTRVRRGISLAEYFERKAKLTGNAQ